MAKEKCIYCGEDLDFPTTGDEHVFIPSLQYLVEDELREENGGLWPEYILRDDDGML